MCVRVCVCVSLSLVCVCCTRIVCTCAAPSLFLWCGDDNLPSFSVSESPSLGLVIRSVCGSLALQAINIKALIADQIGVPIYAQSLVLFGKSSVSSPLPTLFQCSSFSSFWRGSEGRGACASEPTHKGGHQVSLQTKKQTTKQTTNYCSRSRSGYAWRCLSASCPFGGRQGLVSYLCPYAVPE